jgi:hypothetical protein
MQFAWLASRIARHGGVRWIANRDVLVDTATQENPLGECLYPLQIDVRGLHII